MRFVCRTCGASRGSRNKLFDHLREQKHDDRGLGTSLPTPERDELTGDGGGGGTVAELDGGRGSVAELDPESCLSPDIRPDLTSTPVPLPFAPGSKSSLKVARTIEGLLTGDECARLIELTTRRGYSAALVNVGGGMQRRRDEVRRSDRCIIDSPALAEQLYTRLKPLLSALKVDGLEPVGLNERFRFLRYRPGDYFRPHYDGSYVREPGHPRAGDRSLLTLMIYLDSPAGGGETNFVNERHDGSVGVTAVQPSPGLGLVFQHDLYHEGALLRDGTKHAIRTDVMFRPG